jgi:LacI family transcriptional regulator
MALHLHVVHKNTKEQIKLIEQIIEQGADAVALSPNEPEEFVDIVNKLADRGIPIITFNNDISNSKRICYIGSDYTAIGYLAGDVLGKLVKQGKILVVQTSDDYWQLKRRLEGFQHAMLQFPEIEVLYPYESNQEMDVYSFIKGYAEENGFSEIKGIFSLLGNKGENDSLGKAIKAFCRDKIAVVTYDLNSECMYWMQEDVITATVTQDPFAQGFYATKISSIIRR